MSLQKCLLGLTLVLQLTVTLAAPSATEVDRRLQALSGELRCLVCQNQSLADSDADLAIDLRREIRAQIENGKSDEEIRAFLAARYGDFILYEPPFKSATLLLWFGPPVFLGFGLIMLIWNLRRRVPEKPEFGKDG